VASNRTDVEGRWAYTWEEREKILELEFPQEEYQSRLEKLYARMENENISTLLVHGGASTDSNLRYLTGWVSGFGDSYAILSLRSDPIIVTNSIFHSEPMHSLIQTCWVRDFRPLKAFGTVLDQRSVAKHAMDALAEVASGQRRVGYFGAAGSPARYDRELREGLRGVDLVDASPMLAEVRRIKSAREIDVIRALARATTAGMEAALAVAVPGRTESELSAAASEAMIREGCERVTGPRCQSGVRSAMKNVYPLPGKVIREGEIVSIDISGVMKGYVSDHARSTVAGKGSAEQIRLLEACAEAEEAGIAATGPGAMVDDIIAAMSNVVRKHGFAEWDWSCGHGFGLDLVEDPLIVPGNKRPLEAGQTFFIEPMIVPTHMGCSCFEDSILVTDAGAERLTTSRVRTW
jgi:Xaa-Pro aminopeptidase